MCLYFILSLLLVKNRRMYLIIKVECGRRRSNSWLCQAYLHVWITIYGGSYRYRYSILYVYLRIQERNDHGELGQRCSPCSLKPAYSTALPTTVPSTYLSVHHGQS